MNIGEVIYRYAIKFDDGRYFHGGIDTTKETQITDTLNKEIVFFDNLEGLEEDYKIDPRIPKNIGYKPVKVKITISYEEIEDESIKVDGTDDIMYIAPEKYISLKR